MDKVTQLQMQLEGAMSNLEAAQAKAKGLEQRLDQKEQDNAVLAHRLSLAEAAVESAERRLGNVTAATPPSELGQMSNESLVKRVQLLEDELEHSEKTLKDTAAKLRMVEIKADHYDRKITALENQLDDTEKKYEEMERKYMEARTEAEDLARSMEEPL
ncbi:hypothetical protein CALCODRAFT_507737 [Calocera cornea HHB12733]|uniref:Tropomyosin n=1 Tax=Calocera cornea HHB12733 TaxID=1353952 RepID=A0A165HAE5_9BASI|nr:hypothetical protein CALCODRAFT_507737 [Calocera cornea HHB12733]